MTVNIRGRHAHALLPTAAPSSMRTVPRLLIAHSPPCPPPANTSALDQSTAAAAQQLHRNFTLTFHDKVPSSTLSHTRYVSLATAE